MTGFQDLSSRGPDYSALHITTAAFYEPKLYDNPIHQVTHVEQSHESCAACSKMSFSTRIAVPLQKEDVHQDGGTRLCVLPSTHLWRGLHLYSWEKSLPKCSSESFSYKFWLLSKMEKPFAGLSWSAGTAAALAITLSTLVLTCDVIARRHQDHRVTNQCVEQVWREKLL